MYFSQFYAVHARVGDAGAAGGGGASLHTQLLQRSSLSQSPQPSGCMGGHATGRRIGKYDLITSMIQLASELLV